MFASFQVSTVWPSHSAARGASQGASSGTARAISLSLMSATAISPIASRETGGIVPSYVRREPLWKKTFRPVL
jgi:hypothetical protein